MTALVIALLTLGGVLSQHGPWYVRLASAAMVFVGGFLLSASFERRRR